MSVAATQDAAQSAAEQVTYPDCDGEHFMTLVALPKRRHLARLRIEAAEIRAAIAEERIARLAARLREMGIDPEAI